VNAGLARERAGELEFGAVVYLRAPSTIAATAKSGASTPPTIPSAPSTAAESAATNSTAFPSTISARQGTAASSALAAAALSTSTR